MATKKRSKAGNAGKTAAKSRVSERKDAATEEKKAKAPLSEQASSADDATQAAERDTQISSSRGFLDFLSSNRLSIALTSLYVLDSGRGYLCRVDIDTGKAEPIAFCPGFSRGLSFWGGYAIVGTSLPRDGTFSGLELDDNIRARDGEPRCGAFIIDVANGDILHWIRFEGAVRELFDATFIPGTGAPLCVGLNESEMRTLITFDEEALG